MMQPRTIWIMKSKKNKAAVIGRLIRILDYIKVF